MLKRLVAIIFIFVIAGQVTAGVCGCLGGENEPQHSCCKRKKSAIDSMQAKGCCETNCMASESERVPQDRTQPAVKIKFSEVAEPGGIERTPYRPLVAAEAVTLSPYADHRLKYSRPPDLYLRHHAFLI